jgi:Zn-dependent protease with chaperone function
MTGQEYLEDLQAVYRRYHYLLNILQMRRDLLAGKEIHPPTDEDVPRYFRNLAATSADNLPIDLPEELRAKVVADVAAYSAGVRPEVGWVQKRHNEFLTNAPNLASLDIAVGELETASFNASAIPVPGRTNSWVIALNHGVSAVTYEVARTIAGTLNVNIGEARGAEALTSRQAGQILHERLNNYVYLGVPWGDEYNVSRESIVLASIVTTMAERFVYAHELSHIILRHLDGAFLRALHGDWSEAEQTIHRLDQEQEADLLAWELVTRVIVKSINDLQMAYAGASLFLQVADLLERAEDLTAIGTHPPARQRLSSLREAVQRTVNKVGVSFEQVAMIERALSHGLERVLQETPPLPGSDPLEELLDRVSSPSIPDYISFQNEILALLSHSAPSKLCRALGRAMGRAEKDLRDLGIDLNKAPEEGAPPLDQAVLQAARQPFNKLKLLIGLLRLYLTPEIGQFIERSRDEYQKEAR